jgi:N-acetylneuraminic acid mutarotase
MKTRLTIFLLSVSAFFALNAQTSNTWTQLTDFSGVGRSNGVSFVIGNDAYVGTGLSPSGAKLNDFWRYNSSTDSWTQVQNATPYPRHRAIAFAIANKGYMGTGDIGISLEFQTNDFWEYDPSQNIWTVKLSVGLAARQSAVAFVLNNKGMLQLDTLLLQQQ